MMNIQEYRNIESKFGTPCYVFDLEKLRNRVRAMRELTEGKYSLCYSIKANPFLIPSLCEELDHLEVCSPGELAICEALHVPGEKIVYSGVSKTPKDIAEAIDYKAGIFTAESIHQLELIQEKHVGERKLFKKFKKKENKKETVEANNAAGEEKQDERATDTQS